VRLPIGSLVPNRASYPIQKLRVWRFRAWWLKACRPKLASDHDRVCRLENRDDRALLQAREIPGLGCSQRALVPALVRVHAPIPYALRFVL
jgi:hypothetical protein